MIYHQYICIYRLTMLISPEESSHISSRKCKSSSQDMFAPGKVGVQGSPTWLHAAYCYVFPITNHHLPLNMERLECWASAWASAKPLCRGSCLSLNSSRPMVMDPTTASRSLSLQSSLHITIFLTLWVQESLLLCSTDWSCRTPRQCRLHLLCN